MDRFLAVEGLTITRSKLQLVGVAAMFLASKVEEVYAPACSDFVYITDHAYTEDAIKQMEMKILQTLKFNLFEPLSLHFLRRYSKAGDVDVLQHSLAKFAIELALVEYELVPVPGSKLAASALCLSLMLLEPQVSILLDSIGIRKLRPFETWSYLFIRSFNRKGKAVCGARHWSTTVATLRRS